uniref:Uncharacterized protein n=1 Tax=Bacteriophage sp. TaxID=38018 RepID=A0A8D9PE07_9VIRU|nr:MAG TPA: hypothetical protein [Bacteriophage sp.]
MWVSVPLSPDTSEAPWPRLLGRHRAKGNHFLPRT